MPRKVLTTIDNPFNPFTQWLEWWNYDTRNGYRTYERLARLANDSFDLPEEIQEQTYQRAIETLVSFCPGLYKFVYENESNNSETSDASVDSKASETEQELKN